MYSSTTKDIDELRSQLVFADKLLSEALGLILHYKELSVVDHLTGIGNSRAFELALEQTTAEAARSGLPFSLVMIDVDKFKQVNDEVGHQGGNKVLQELVCIMSSVKRKADGLFRTGGDEFYLIMPNTAGDEAVLATNRLLGIVAETRISLLGRPVTISCGLATWTKNFTEQHSKDVTARLIENADMCMYSAKRFGNSVSRL